MAGLYHTVYAQVKVTISLYMGTDDMPCDFLNDLGFGFTFRQAFDNAFGGYDFTDHITSGKARRLEEKAPMKWVLNKKEEVLFFPNEGVVVHMEVVRDLFGHRYVKSRSPRIISSRPIDIPLLETI